MNPDRVMGRMAVAAVLGYAMLIALRPLNANDLFWHLASGREILTTWSIPRTDPFSFASDAGPWVDHEWLWQLGAQAIYRGASRGRGPEPDPAGCLGLVLMGVAVVAGAFAVSLAALRRNHVPVGGIVAFGLIAVQIAKERLTVRPETASLLFLALFLHVLTGRASGPRRGLRLALLSAVWANVHPAVLLAPALVLLEALGERFGPRRARRPVVAAGPDSGPGHGLGASHEAGRDPGASRAGEPLRRPVDPGAAPSLVSGGIEVALVGLATLLNPYGHGLWTVPLKLSALVKNARFHNPEWLAPPLAIFPFFYVGLALVLIAVIAAAVRERRLPAGPLLMALALGAIASRQMRHLGLFAVAWLFASDGILRALDPRGGFTRRLGQPAIERLAVAGALVAALFVPIGGLGTTFGAGLETGRFPVEACEAMAANAPPVRLYNDVRFGGYLVWRFFPQRKVFIDGRNEVYPALLSRLARIQSGAAGSYEDWRKLIRDLRIEGAILTYKDPITVIQPPQAPGDAPVRTERAWSSYFFPSRDWALVYFDDTALVFVKRDGEAGSWANRGEYRSYNPEDGAYLLARARQDPSLALRLRSEAERRLRESPPSMRAARFLADLSP